MPFTITESASSQPCPSGKYVAVLERVESASGGQFSGTFRKWYFLADVNGETIPVSGTSSENNGTRSKTYQWLTALLGREPNIGETIPDPVGSKCIVEVGQKDGYPRIVDVQPFAEPTESIIPGVPR